MNEMFTIASLGGEIGSALVPASYADFDLHPSKCLPNLTRRTL